jgi:hypothetical protein
MGESRELTSAGHVFISYVKEDRDKVESLRAFLEAGGVRVWTDKENIEPGQDWKLTIEEAITKRALVFLACFSDNSAARDVTYQNEELNLAADQIRLRSMDHAWFMPVRLAECDLPTMRISASRALSDFQAIDMFGVDEQNNRARLLSAVLRVLGQSGQVVAVSPGTPTSNESPTGSAVEMSRSVEDSIRLLISEPSRQMAFEELVMDEAARTHDRLISLELFPTGLPALTGADQVEAVKTIVEQYGIYWDVIAPMTQTITTAAAWADSGQARVLARAVQTVAGTVQSQRSGQSVLLSMRHYPLVVLTYAAALGALSRDNYASLRAVTTDAQVRADDGKHPAIAWASPGEACPVEVAGTVLALSEEQQVEDEVISSLLQRGGNRYTPISDHLFARLRPMLKRAVPSDEDYDELFDQMEVLLALITCDAYLQARANNRYIHGPTLGRFTWKHRYVGERAPERVMQAEFQAQGDDWAPLHAGLMGRSVERAIAAFDLLVERADSSRQHRF